MNNRKPQQVPKVLQRKPAAPAGTSPPGKPRTPVAAPAVYRPQTTPQCLQLKKAGSQPGPVGPRAAQPSGRELQLMEIPKGVSQSDEIKPEITPHANGAFDALPMNAMLNIFARVDVSLASHLAQSQQSLNTVKRKFSATTDWGIFWITEHSYFQGITYDKGKRQGNAGMNKIPATHRQKKIGVSIKIEFVAGPKVQADKIGLTQIVQHYVQGKPMSVDPYKQKMLVTDAVEGYKAHVDVIKESVDPMYAWDTKQTVNVGQKVGTGSSKPFIGQWGTSQQNATLIDEPQDRGAAGPQSSLKNAPNSGQIFETTALALEGAQEGTYYGSVKWGWKTDAEGNFQILSLTVVSRGSVSETFVKAIETWNKYPNTKQYSNRKLPLPK